MEIKKRQVWEFNANGYHYQILVTGLAYLLYDPYLSGYIVSGEVVKIFTNSPFALKTIGEFVIKSNHWKLVESSIDGSNCKICNVFNEYVNDLDYTCWSCKNG